MPGRLFQKKSDKDERDQPSAAWIRMHAGIIRIAGLLFDEVPAGIESLSFECGTEQGERRPVDHTRSGIRSNLIAARPACEDADEENGTLFYYSGSHKLHSGARQS